MAVVTVRTYAADSTASLLILQTANTRRTKLALKYKFHNTDMSHMYPVTPFPASSPVCKAVMFLSLTAGSYPLAHCAVVCWRNFHTTFR